MNFYLAIFVFLFGFGLYANTIYHDYAYDDVSVILDNRLTQMGLEGIPELFTKAYWYGFRGDNYGTYRPLSLITFALEYEFIGNNPHVSHFINVLLYACTALVLFIVLLQLFNGSIPLAKNQKYLLPLLITLVYIAHPVHTEVVANIKSRDEVMCLLFFLLAMLFILDYLFNKTIQQSKGKSALYLFLALIFYYLSVISKETAITFIAIIPLTLYFFTKLSSKKILIVSSYFLGIALIYLAMRLSFLDSFAEGQNLAPIDNTIAASLNYSQRFATPVYILMLYLKLLVVPHPLIYDYSYKMIDIVEWTNWKAILSFLIHIGLAIWAFKGFRNKDKIAYGIWIYVIPLSLVSNIVILIGSTMAERFLFIPSLGFSFALIFLLIKFFKIEEESGFTISEMIKKNKSLISIVAIILVFYCFKTVTRNEVWKDNFTLYSADIENTAKSARANLFYGQELLEMGKVESDPGKKKEFFDDTKKYISKAGVIDPTYSDVWLNLGIAYVESGDNQTAIQNYQKVITIDPKYDKAYYNMGNAYFNLKDWNKAEETYRKAFEINPQYVKAYYNLGNVYLKLNRNKEAVQYYDKALILDPGYVDIYNNKGNALTNMDEYEKAVEVYKKAISINPNGPMLYNNMGNALNHMKKYDEAIASFKKAIQINPTYLSAINNIGVAYFYKKNYKEAIKFFSRVLQVDPKDRGAVMNIGFCYQQLGDKKKAKQFFDKAKTI
ncbi:MAG: tetratricopeptide repeat protein [Bacteroidia bacterium]|nr:tetratricopeptide repeat protein [Bacteroidia bacterium]